MKTTMNQVFEVMPIVKPFIGAQQLGCMADLARGEEGGFFKNKFLEIAEIVKNMPTTGETDGQGEAAIAYLHYFTRGFDGFITEKDINGGGQLQAFGLVKLFETELGYISIQEIIEAGAQLDLFWTPKTLKECRKA